jgi:hypothetical protein
MQKSRSAPAPTRPARSNDGRQPGPQDAVYARGHTVYCKQARGTTKKIENFPLPGFRLKKAGQKEAKKYGKKPDLKKPCSTFHFLLEKRKRSKENLPLSFGKKKVEQRKPILA